MINNMIVDNFEQIKAIADFLRAPVFRTSAKTGENLTALFTCAAKRPYAFYVERRGGRFIFVVDVEVLVCY